MIALMFLNFIAKDCCMIFVRLSYHALLVVNNRFVYLGKVSRNEAVEIAQRELIIGAKPNADYLVTVMINPKTGSDLAAGSPSYTIRRALLTIRHYCRYCYIYLKIGR